MTGTLRYDTTEYPRILIGDTSIEDLFDSFVRYLDSIKAKDLKISDRRFLLSKKAVLYGYADGDRILSYRVRGNHFAVCTQMVEEIFGKIPAAIYFKKI